MEGDPTFCSFLLSASTDERTDLISSVCFFTKSSSRFTSWSLRCFFSSSVWCLILRRSSSYCCFIYSVSILASFLVYKQEKGPCKPASMGWGAGHHRFSLVQSLQHLHTGFTARSSRGHKVHRIIDLIFVTALTLSTISKRLFGNVYLQSWDWIFQPTPAVSKEFFVCFDWGTDGGSPMQVSSFPGTSERSGENSAILVS